MEVYKYPLEWNQSCGFNPLWKYVKDVCNDVFFMIGSKENDNLVESYTKLCSQITVAHALVYRLISNECTDCPFLFRNNEVRVEGDKPQSTQVLILYYILREALKLHLSSMKCKIVASSDIVNSYIDGFERFSSALNVIKAIFIYLQWVWQKRGLPSEHIILPTELVGFHLWSGIIIDSHIHNSLSTHVSAIVRDVRENMSFNVTQMESVKRLSLSLYMLTYIRENQYVSIIEQRYLSEMLEFNSKVKLSLKSCTPENYIINCFNSVQKEEQIMCFFLHPNSYCHVSAKLIELYVNEEMPRIKSSASNWLTLYKRSISEHEEESLFALYHLLGKVNDLHWLKNLISFKMREYVQSSVKEELGHNNGVDSNSESALSYLDIIRRCYTTYQELLRKVFEWTETVEDAFINGLRCILNDLSRCSCYGGISYASSDVATTTAEIKKMHENSDVLEHHRAEEVSSQEVVSGNMQHIDDVDNNTVAVQNNNTISEVPSPLYYDVVKTLAIVMISDNTLIEETKEAHATSHEAATKSLCERYDWSIVLFALLSNKEFFYSTYIKLLEQRLLQIITSYNVTRGSMLNSKNYKNEKNRIDTIFKHGGSVEFAALCARMLQDVYIRSLSQVEQFSHDVPAFYPFVLSKHAWASLSNPTANEINAMPNSLRNKINFFMSSHLNSRRGVGRRLKFLPQYSTAVMRLQIWEGKTSGAKALGMNNANKPTLSSSYIRIVMTCRQTLIAIAFNEHRSWNSAKLSQRCNLSEPECMQVVQDFVKSGILRVTLNEITLDTEQIRKIKRSVVSLLPSSHFNSQLTKHTSAKEHIFASTARKGYTNDERRVIESQVIYELKKNGLQTLVEVYNKVSPKIKACTFTIPELKVIIEKLIETEYVERDTNNGKIKYKS